METQLQTTTATTGKTAHTRQLTQQTNNYKQAVHNNNKINRKGNTHRKQPKETAANTKTTDNQNKQQQKQKQ